MRQMALQVLSPPKLALITDSAMMFKVLAISHCRALRAGSTAMALEASSRLESTRAGRQYTPGPWQQEEHQKAVGRHSCHSQGTYALQAHLTPAPEPSTAGRTL